MVSEESVSRYISIIVDYLIPTYLGSLKDGEDEFIIIIDKDMINGDKDRMANAILTKYKKTIYSVYTYDELEACWYLACKVKDTSDIFDEELKSAISKAQCDNDKALPVVICESTGYVTRVGCVLTMPLLDYDPALKEGHDRNYLIIGAQSAEKTIESIDDLKSVDSPNVKVYYDR